MSKQSEKQLLDDARMATQELGVRLYRNNVGEAVFHDHCPRCDLNLHHARGGRRVRYGLFKGSSDLVGWAPVDITPRLVGRRLPVFTSLEAKQGSGRLTGDQRAWLEAISRNNGLVGVFGSPEMAHDILAARISMLEDGLVVPGLDAAD